MSPVPTPCREIEEKCRYVVVQGVPVLACPTLKYEFVWVTGPYVPLPAVSESSFGSGGVNRQKIVCAQKRACSCDDDIQEADDDCRPLTLVSLQYAYARWPDGNPCEPLEE